ncbi:distal tail protein Dit [Enterococcus phage IME-EFm5]|uniref:Minor tail protein n=1 Tax=Enterococcus phage IME-EFm5 TaxID=1718158 RepID=A0A0M4RT83_9CAUD|nr:distal tail protein Dit [Enterococcus phage IME-EFm5]ALF02005.1 minor tail protein [Enterococcus phage IME-EFm5]
MGQNYEFLRSFTIDGKETKHLFQIAKLNIPFLSKENEFFQVGNTDGKHFRNTRLGDYTLSIDGFIIKDNTGKTVPQVMDELKALVNSDEPQKLVFDMFPDRYFNAIFTGAEEYDATDLKYTPLTLTFDVPDGLAHATESIGFSNTYSTTTNVMLDSEYNAINKYMKPWVQKLDEKFNNSNVVQGDFTNGVPLNFERDDKTDERWLNWNPATTIHTDELKVGDDVNFSVYAQVVSIDEENTKDYAGQVILEEWDTVKGAILKRHIVYIPKKVTTEFTEYGSVVKIENEKTNAINLQYGFRGSNLIKWSKPMVSFLPPIGATVTAPSVGAKAYSNSLDFGEYDYSGNPNLMNNLSFSDFVVQAGSGTISDGGKYLKINKTSGTNFFVMAGYKNGTYYLTPVLSNTTYTITYTLRKSSNFVPQSGKRIIMRYRLNQNNVTNNLGELILDSTNVNAEFTTYTKTFTTGTLVNPNSYYFQVLVEEGLSGEIELSYEIKLERGSTATPYQPNLLDAPYYLSKIPLGENILKPASFPINTTEYMAASFTPNEPYVQGQKYTFTMKASKPYTQTFGIFLRAGSLPVGNMAPVEGLVDVWEITFTITQAHIDGNANAVNVFQLPQSTKGTVNIEWAKLEKGDTRTPNIPYYKYEGIAPAPSNNPKDYHWGYSPSYINAVEYVASGDSVGDLIKIENNGTYRTKPRFSFRMRGENGLVALLNQNGAILQFGNPEDVDGTTSSRVEPAMNETFWGNTLNPALKVNTGFKSVYPNMNSNPATPNRIQGTLNMKDDPDAVQPVYTGVGDINVWHGPTVVGDIAAPSNTDRTLPITTHFRFGFDNYNKGQRGRLEFSTFDELGNPIMTAIIRDSSTASNELVFEAWYKNNKLHQMKLDRKVFNKSFYEMNMDRRGNRLVWRVVQIKSLNQAPGGWSQATIDKEYKFVWTLPEPDTSKFTKAGFWFMRFSNKYGVIMRMTDMQARWEGTPYYQDLKNYFQDGDLVEIDTATREFFVNGVVNNQLNVVGNQWEKFELETGETTIQPIVSEWANMAEVTAEITQNYL